MFRRPDRARSPVAGTLILLVAGLLAGCQAAPAAPTAVAPALVPSVAATEAAQPLSPAVVYVVGTPGGASDRPAGVALAAPAGPTAVPTATSDPANWPTMTPTAGPTEPTFTPSPPPATFTPPAKPPAPADDHYWFYRPVPNGDVVWTNKAYPYGSTRGGTLRPHHGVEFDVPTGTPILAANSGTVVVAGDDLAVAYGPATDFYGNLVVVEHDFTSNGRPVYTLYGHLSQVDVAVGQAVAAGQALGLSGGSGVADGPHLHFEVRIGQNSYAATRNPLLWLYPFPNRGTVAGRITWPGGAPVEEAPVSLRRIDAPSRYAATTTYAGATVNADDGWGENFAIDDVEAGFYELTAGAGEDAVKQTLWVYPYQTSFVALTLSN